MNRLLLFALLALLSISAYARPKGSEPPKFPENFVWAAATSAYQVEGGIIGTGRGMSIWDRFLQVHPAADNRTGDIACDTYHKYKSDAILMKKQGLQSYRFSISWPRIFPDGLPHRVNKEGVQYYHNLIDSLLEQGITPVVTLYHWDLPQSLGDHGGWINDEIVDWFGEYARFCFNQYGSKIKQWITINEPHTQSIYGYCGQIAQHAPGGFQQNCEWSLYQAGHNYILAHGRAASIYRKEFQPTQKGTVGMTMNVIWYEPETPNDEEAANLAFQMMFGWFANAIYGEGDYPEVMRRRFEELRKEEGRETSRLPKFTEKQIQELKGSADFIGVNYYIALVTSTNASTLETQKKISPTIYSQWGHDVGRNVYYFTPDSWKQMGAGPTTWIRYHPEGLRKILNFIKKNYGNVPVFITENGVMETPGEGLNDVSRIFFIKGHLEAIQRAVVEDKCDVRGYFFWSLFDNFEWGSGYTDRFGMYHVDFNSPERTRTPRASAHWYKRVIDNNALVD